MKPIPIEATETTYDVWYLYEKWRIYGEFPTERDADEFIENDMHYMKLPRERYVKVKCVREIVG